MHPKIFIRFMVFVPLVLLLSCDNPEDEDDNMPDNGKNIQIMNPQGGETFTVGQTVTISFRVNADQIPGAVPQVTINGGQTWNDIMSPQISPEPGGGGQLLEYDWIIGQEVIPVTYTGTLSQCMVKVYKYGENADFDQTGSFTIIGQ